MLFCEFLFAVIEDRIFGICVCSNSKSHFFPFIKSRSLKIRSHIPSTVGPGKEGLTSFLGRNVRN